MKNRHLWSPVPYSSRILIIFLFFILQLVFFTTPTASADQRIVTIAPKTVMWLSDQVGSLPMEKEMGVNEAQRLFNAGQITWNKSGNPGFGYDRSFVWLVFQYRAVNVEKTAIEIGYAPLDHVTVFVSDEGANAKPEQVYQSGDQHPFTERPIEHRRLIIPLPDSEQAVQTVFVHVESSGSLKIPIRIADYDALANQNAMESVFDGIYFGAFLLVSILNVMNYLTFRHRKYLIYIGSVLSLGFFVATYKGYGAAYIWIDQFWLNQYAIVIFVLFSVFLMAWFSMDFLELRSKSPLMAKIIIGYLVLNVIFLLFCFWIPYNISSKIAAQDSLLCSLLLTISGMVRIHLDRKAIFFTLAFLFQLSGIAITAATVLGIMPSYPWAEHSVQIGSFLQMTLLFIALSDEIQQIRREKETSDAQRIASDAKRLEAIAETARLEEENLKQLAEWNSQLENKVTEKTNALQQLLDHSEEGFFTIERSTQIGVEHSAICRQFFGDLFSGQRAGTILTASHPENEPFFQQIIEDVFSSSLEMQREVFLSLLPETIATREYVVKLQFKWVEASTNRPEHILCIASDLTGEAQLKSQLETERNHFEMVVTVFTQQESYVELSSCIEELLNEQLPYWMSKSDLDAFLYQSMMRTVHTIKGQADQLKMMNTAKVLHTIENELIDHNRFVSDVREQVHSAWDADHMILEKWLDERTLAQESMVSIERSKLMAFRDQIAQGVAHFQLLPIINSYLYVSIYELLETYEAYVERIARSMDKWVKPLEITGEPLELDRERFQPFIRSLVHIFRNMIDHGIETVEERLECEKEEWGTIRCEISQQNNRLLLTIQDDGRGIQPDTIRVKAIERGLISEKGAEQMSENQIIDLIWKDGFSTKEEVSELSGRGVGLSAVKEQVARLNGSVQVMSTNGGGTRFCFDLPLEEEMVDVEI